MPPRRPRRSTVYYLSARSRSWEYAASLPGKLETLLQRLDLSKYVGEGEVVPIKLHLGSEGSFRVVRPVFVRKVVEAVKAVGGKPFVTDTTRIPGVDYLEVAAYNGFTHLTCGAPVVMADGIFGKDCVMVKVDGAQFIDEIGVASAIYTAPAMIVVSHAKGHIGTGFAGALKNVAMGGVSSGSHHGHAPRGKMHTVENLPPQRDPEICDLCGKCLEVCPVDAIEVNDERQYWALDAQLCQRCMRCTRVCPTDALSAPMNAENFAKALAEGAQAVLSTFGRRKVVYINLALEMQPACDCMPSCDTPALQDQGIFAGDDMVAVDYATLEACKRATPLPQSAAGDKELVSADDNIWLEITGKDPYVPLDHAESLSLGSSQYRLIQVDKDREPPLIEAAEMAQAGRVQQS